MKVDLHNHTKLCNHAKGEVFEYIEKAIEVKTKYFGFCDHAPMEFEKEYRMSFDQMKLYEQMIMQAKEKYKSQIDILLGYEVDYLEGYIDERVLKAEVDYLIGSVHFIDKWGFDNPAFIGRYKHKDIDKIWQDYFDAIEQMAKSGLFQIAGHIDLIKIFNFLPKKDVRIIANDALLAIKKAGMVIELNTSGYRKPIQEAYPSSLILEQMSELDIPITFSSDAHDPKQVGFKSREIEELAKEFGYNKCAIFRQKERELIKF